LTIALAPKAALDFTVLPFWEVDGESEGQKGGLDEGKIGCNTIGCCSCAWIWFIADLWRLPKRAKEGLIQGNSSGGKCGAGAA
jgi:hypothetical protein